MEVDCMIVLTERYRVTTSNWQGGGKGVTGLLVCLYFLKETPEK